MSPRQKAQRRRATPLTRFAAGREMPVFMEMLSLFSPREKANAKIQSPRETQKAQILSLYTENIRRRHKTLKHSILTHDWNKS